MLFRLSRSCVGAGDDSGEEANPDEPDSLRNHPLPHSILLQPV